MRSLACVAAPLLLAQQAHAACSDTRAENYDYEAPGDASSGCILPPTFYCNDPEASNYVAGVCPEPFAFLNRAGCVRSETPRGPFHPHPLGIAR